MSDFLIDEMGNHVWYDLRSEYLDWGNRIKFRIKHPNILEYYIRPHNDDGPAIIWSFGLIEWYLQGEKYRFEDWCKILTKSEEEINFLKLKYFI